MTETSAHFNKLLDLIEVEREAEKEENKRALDRWPVEMRETLGKTVSRLTIESRNSGVGGIPLLVLSRPPAGEALSPFHNMDQGDLVRLTFTGSEGSVDGTMYDVEEYRATVALNEDPVDPPRGYCRIDLLGSDATYRRMRKALEMAREAGGRLGKLRDALLGITAPKIGPTPEIHFLDDHLNAYQRQAVLAALAAEDVAVVHGPPGTGKTTVLVEIIRQAAKQGKRILASAPSNIAVDNMLEKLLNAGVRAIRLGHPARTLENLRHATLMALVAEHPEQRFIQQMDEDREALVAELHRGRLPSDHEKTVRREIQALWKEARKVERAIARLIIEGAQVILATHGGIGRQLGNEKFDIAVLDEASQATEALSWIPIVPSKKIILAGDPLQLPPTVYSEKAAKEGLKITLMERLQAVLPDNMKTLLRIQYRMHETIMGFSSDCFYEGKLEADDSVKSHLAMELPGVKRTELTGHPVIYVDTAGTGYSEVWNEILDSRENAGEAQLALTIWKQLSEAGIAPQQAAIITPYAAQSKLLKPQVPRGLEVGTVDGFQGREKEVVIVSLVRSNETGEVGFLSDTRRMNVAMTRARRLLIVIGDSTTIGRHPFYIKFLDYVEKHAIHRSAYEWMTS